MHPLPWLYEPPINTAKKRNTCLRIVVVRWGLGKTRRTAYIKGKGVLRADMDAALYLVAAALLAVLILFVLKVRRKTQEGEQLWSRGWKTAERMRSVSIAFSELLL